MAVAMLLLKAKRTTIVDLSENQAIVFSWLWGKEHSFGENVNPKDNLAISSKCRDNMAS